MNFIIMDIWSYFISYLFNFLLELKFHFELNLNFQFSFHTHTALRRSGARTRRHAHPRDGEAGHDGPGAEDEDLGAAAWFTCVLSSNVTTRVITNYMFSYM